MDGVKDRLVNADQYKKEVLEQVPEALFSVCKKIMDLSFIEEPPYDELLTVLKSMSTTNRQQTGVLKS